MCAAVLNGVAISVWGSCVLQAFAWAAGNERWRLPRHGTAQSVAAQVEGGRRARTSARAAAPAGNEDIWHILTLSQAGPPASSEGGPGPHPHPLPHSVWPLTVEVAEEGQPQVEDLGAE